MSDPRDEDVDPRYSAVFQRGYDPARDGIPEPDRVPEPEPEPEQAPKPTGDAEEQEVDSSGADDPEIRDDHEVEPETVPTTIAVRSVVVLGVGSIAFLVAAIAITLAPDAPSSSITFVSLLRLALPPALMLGGGIGLALTAVLASVRVSR